MIDQRQAPADDAGRSHLFRWHAITLDDEDEAFGGDRFACGLRPAPRSGKQSGGETWHPQTGRGPSRCCDEW